MSSMNKSLPEPLKTVWKFFASIQLTVAVLLSLAFASIIGTLIPQNEAPQKYLLEYGDLLFRFFSALDFFDMYHSWWFQLLLVLLSGNIIVCSFDRLAATWSIIFPKERHFKPDRFRRVNPNCQFESTKEITTLKTVLPQSLNQVFGYLKMEDSPNGFLIFAEKGRWTRLGVYAVHLSVLLLLIGGLIGSFFGFDAMMTIAEGESTDLVQIRNTGEPKQLGFTIRNDDFKLTLYPNGVPKEFLASLSILENGQVIRQKDIIVNDPLRHRDINFYLSSYGELSPDASPKPETANAEPPSEIVLNLTSSESKMTYRREITMGKTIDLPEGLGQFVLKAFRDKAKFGGQEIGPALVGELTHVDGKTEEILLPLQFPNFDKMRRGKVTIAVAEQPQKNFTPAEPTDIQYYTVIGVTHDPGVWVVYCGFIMMIVGCYIAFFTSHQQIFIEVTHNDDKSQLIFLSGISNKDKLTMQRKVLRLRDKLTELT